VEELDIRERIDEFMQEVVNLLLTQGELRGQTGLKAKNCGAVIEKKVVGIYYEGKGFYISRTYSSQDRLGRLLREFFEKERLQEGVIENAKGLV